MNSIIDTKTAEDLLRMSRGRKRHELIEGVLRDMSPAGSKHGRIAMRLGWRLAQHVEEHNLGEVYAAETGFLIARDPDTVRAPDVAFVHRERAEAIGDVEGYWPGAPDVAVEVISPGDSYTEVEEKALNWMDAGTTVVVVINPRNYTVTVYRDRNHIVILAKDETLDMADAIPGFTLSIRELFE